MTGYYDFALRREELELARVQQLWLSKRSELIELEREYRDLKDRLNIETVTVDEIHRRTVLEEALPEIRRNAETLRVQAQRELPARIIRRRNWLQSPSGRAFTVAAMAQWQGEQT